MIWFTSDLHFFHDRILEFHPKRKELFGNTVEKAKEEVDKYLNLDDDTYAILDNNDSWINIRAELAKKGIGVTYIRDIEELFNL